MKIVTSYNVRIKTEYISALKDTVAIYTDAVRFFIDVVLKEWDHIHSLRSLEAQSYIESVSHRTAQHDEIIYSFDESYPKMPSYLRRAAITTAIGKVRSYKSNLTNWEAEDPATRGKAPSIPKLTAEMPAFYKGGMFKRTGDYIARLKLFIHNDWQYINVGLRKCDVDYILHHCSLRQEMAPVLRHNHKVWELSFSYKEEHKINQTLLSDRLILAVDLGINNPCTCSVMASDGTVLGRHFYKAPVEEDSLNHKLNKLKKAQQHGSRKMPKLWASVNGMNTKLSRDTADFIIATAVLYNVDVIVMEHLDTDGKKRGSKKQRLHMWKKQAVQKQVELQAHRLGIRISHVCARNTSRLAYDGSGRVERGTYMSGTEERYNYSICTFKTGKQYNCDLNASYNIGARYFIREILKSLPEKAGLHILAEVPECSKRSTCTLSSLIKLCAVLAA